MIIIANPVWIVLEAINIAIFLLLWRIILMGHYGTKLERIKGHTEALLDSFCTAVGRLWYGATQRHLSQRGKLVAVLLLLLFVQLVLLGLARLL